MEQYETITPYFVHFKQQLLDLKNAFTLVKFSDSSEEQEQLTSLWELTDTYQNRDYSSLKLVSGYKTVLAQIDKFVTEFKIDMLYADTKSDPSYMSK